MSWDMKEIKLIKLYFYWIFMENSKKDESLVGSLINFRGLVYSPINEQGVVFLFGRILEDLNMYIEEVRTKYPDCVARRYTGKGWEKVYIEFEYTSNNFIQHEHDPTLCDIIVCWKDDLSQEDKKKLEGIEIIELKSIINTPEIPNKPIEEPSKILEKTEYNLEHHFKRRTVNKNIQELYHKLDESIKLINDSIFRKFSKTAITYYCPEKMFVFCRLQKNGIRLNIFTNEKNIDGVKNIKNHENWGIISLRKEKDFERVLNSIKESYEIMKQAVEENINTGWYAKTPKDHEEDIDEEE